MTMARSTNGRDIRDAFMNITLLLISLGMWAFILAGDILPGSMPDIIMFDAVIMIVVCGISYFIKSRSFNLACFFLLFCIALFAAQITIASGYSTVLYLIPASFIIAVILLPLPLVVVLILIDSLFLLAFAPPGDALFMLILSGIQLTTIGLLKRFYLDELKISQGFQNYAAEQMNEARESRAKLVLMSKQLQEYQERLRVINNKLEIAFEQAEDARLAKARFAANVSHELRTPINLIVGFSEVMIIAPEVYDQPLPAAYSADIQAVYRNAKHLQNLIDDVLDISQLEARHLAIVKEKASLGKCVIDTADMVADLIARKGLDFALDIPDELPDLWFDPVRIRQILLNLLVNAVRFTSDGKITIEIAVDDNQVVTSVIDTGIGLSADDINHVFDEFYQVDAGVDYDERGSGLGLTLSQELIRLHGGTMTVCSAGVPGKGSTFSFSLPTTRSLVSQMPASNLHQSTSIEEKKVLIVDPDEAITGFFSRYLKSHNIAVCNREADAVRTLAEFQPDTLLLAHNHRYARLLETIARDNISLNLITLPMPSGREAIRRRGVYDYLVKPVSRQMLDKVLSQFGDSLASIMIIDDNRDIVRLFSQTLRSLERGYTVRAAYGGKEGISIMRENPPDLLMLDVLMPGMDGFEVISTMQASPELRDIPIILVSAKGASESITPNIYGEITIAREGGYSPIELVTCIQALVDSIRPPADRELTNTRIAIKAPA